MKFANIFNTQKSKENVHLKRRKSAFLRQNIVQYGLQLIFNTIKHEIKKYF